MTFDAKNQSCGGYEVLGTNVVREVVRGQPVNEALRLASELMKLGLDHAMVTQVLVAYLGEINADGAESVTTTSTTRSQRRSKRKKDRYLRLQRMPDAPGMCYLRGIVVDKRQYVYDKLGENVDFLAFVGLDQDCYDLQALGNLELVYVDEAQAYHFRVPSFDYVGVFADQVIAEALFRYHWINSPLRECIKRVDGACGFLLPYSSKFGATLMHVEMKFFVDDELGTSLSLMSDEISQDTSHAFLSFVVPTLPERVGFDASTYAVVDGKLMYGFNELHEGSVVTLRPMKPLSKLVFPLIKMVDVDGFNAASIFRASRLDEEVSNDLLSLRFGLIEQLVTFPDVHINGIAMGTVGADGVELPANVPSDHGETITLFIFTDFVCVDSLSDGLQQEGVLTSSGLTRTVLWYGNVDGHCGLCTSSNLAVSYVMVKLISSSGWQELASMLQDLDCYVGATEIYEGIGGGVLSSVFYNYARVPKMSANPALCDSVTSTCLTNSAVAWLNYNDMTADDDLHDGFKAYESLGGYPTIGRIRDFNGGYPDYKICTRNGGYKVCSAYQCNDYVEFDSGIDDSMLIIGHHTDIL